MQKDGVIIIKQWPWCTKMNFNICTGLLKAPDVNISFSWMKPSINIWHTYWTASIACRAFSLRSVLKWTTFCVSVVLSCPDNVSYEIHIYKVFFVIYEINVKGYTSYTLLDKHDYVCHNSRDKYWYTEIKCQKPWHIFLFTQSLQGLMSVWD